MNSVFEKAETHMIFVSQLLEEDGSDGLDSPVGVAAGAFYTLRQCCTD